MIQRAEFRVYRQKDGAYVVVADVERVGDTSKKYVRVTGASPGEALAAAIEKVGYLK